MSCHSCDVTGLGCSSCDTNHIGLTTHSPLHYGLGSPLLTSKVLLHEFTVHLSASLLADNSPHKTKIEESLTNGSLGKYGRCRLSAAVQVVAAEVSQRLGLEILHKVEKTLKDDEAAREKARKASEEAARKRAEAIARETAREVATEIANAQVQAAMRAFEAEQDMQNFEKTNLVAFKNIPAGEFQEAIREAAKRAPAAIKRFNIPQELNSKMPRLALYDFFVLCDNSGSMTVEKSRIPTLNATVRGLFNVQKELGSMRQFNIIPFAGDFWTDVEESDEVERAIHSFQYGRGGDAVGPLRERILKRLERDANEKALYPSVSVIITDGEISVPKLGESIAEMKQTLEYNGYSGPASLFLICRVGSSENAARSLRSLNDIPAIRDMVFLSEDQLDTKLMSMQNDVDLYAGWVVGELLKAMELQVFTS